MKIPQNSLNIRFEYFWFQILNIIKQPNEILTTPCEKVSEEERMSFDFQELINNMLETMKENNGVGLAANQIGISKQLAIIQHPKMKSPLIMINPRVVRSWGKKEHEEGCLSLPGELFKVTRHKEIKVKAMREYGTVL